nr:peptidase [Amycolatopsis tolypomycina]
MYRPGIGGVVGGGGLLATTGANLTWWIVFGVVSLVLGVVLVRSARRRAQETSN